MNTTVPAAVATASLQSPTRPADRIRGEEGVDKYRSLISPGLVQALDHVPFHNGGMAPLLRRVLTGDGVHPQAEKCIVVHEIQDVSADRRTYCCLHVHQCPEINVLLTLTHLTYEIALGDEVFLVRAPASIYIPAGLAHSANVVEGSGFFVALIEASEYAATAPNVDNPALHHAG